jgi:urea carboxylase-associated protein 2
MPTLISSETIAGGQAWSRVLTRHQALTVTDPSGEASVALFAFRAAAPVERYNMPDTLKAQHTAFLTAGRILMSDMGHVLLSLTEDSCGWHDTISGHGDAADALRAFGPSSYQQQRNAMVRNTRDNVLIEFGKHELGLRDLHANVNLFTKVIVSDDGQLQFVPGHAPGSSVTLRAEVATLVVLSNTPHPLDPSTTYAPPAIELRITSVAPPGPDDHCRTSRPENVRAFLRTEVLP